MLRFTSDTTSKEDHRGLRLLTVLAILPTFALLLPYGILTARLLPTVGIVTMFFSAVFGTLVLNGRVQSTSRKVCVDLLIASLILAILIPSWVSLTQSHWSRRHGRLVIIGTSRRTSGGLIVLGTYGTTPMMFNFATHLYLALYAIGTRLSFQRHPIECPNCHHEIIRTSHPFGKKSSTAKENGSYQDAPQPRFSFYDDARTSSEFQTSGCNTSRQSAETLAESERTSRDLLDVGTITQGQCESH